MEILNNTANMQRGQVTTGTAAVTTPTATVSTVHIR